MTSATKPSTERVLVVVLDRTLARFFEVTAGGTSELTSLHSPAMRGGRFHSDRQGGPGWGEKEYHGRIREEERRHLEGVVEQLEHFDCNPGDALLVAGPKTAVAALTRSLPPALADRLMGTAHLNPTAVTPAAVERVVHTAQSAQRPATERGVLVAIREGLGRGRATNGAQETLRALAKRQVRMLLVPADAVPGTELIQQAIRDAHDQDAAVLTIHEPEVAKQIDVMAALLRWSSDTALGTAE
jgi:peptide subunit release factor 1 (eRF1)